MGQTDMGKQSIIIADARRSDMNKARAKAAVIGIVIAVMSLAGFRYGPGRHHGCDGNPLQPGRPGRLCQRTRRRLALQLGLRAGAGLMQYPGPTLIVNQGATITVTLKNELPAPAGNVSIVFPGHVVTASGGVAGKLDPGGAAGRDHHRDLHLHRDKPGHLHLLQRHQRRRCRWRWGWWGPSS